MTQSDTDRNLLFGVLALQIELIDPPRFADVCAGWAARKDVSLGGLLVERGWITADDQRQVEQLLTRKLKKHGGDVRATLGAVAGGDAEARHTLQAVAAPALRESITALPVPPPAYLPFDETVAPISEPQRARYTLTRLQGEGGLGKVWVACDQDLNREVALKELRPDQARHPDAWHRFLKEAQVTGQLEHPNIVPVYELGRRPEDDQPYYTMRLVRGQTMRRAIADYHRRRKAREADPLDLQKLLSACGAVCHAIDFAHARRIIHRDLKPENVMLGDFGEVIVLDWGLAKMIDLPEPPPGDPRTAVTIEHASPSVRLSAEASTQPTLGQVGTPAYMAPEQVEARADQMDARTDIYALGAMLFEVLTGRPPHDGKSTAELFEQILGGEVPKARTLVATVPGPLEAIAAKAMARQRSQRYGRAIELAEDIQRWIADEPVSVYRDSLATRFARWGRRHQGTASALAALLVSAVAALALIAVLVNAERARTETQRQRAVASEANALENFRLANDAADGMLTEVGDVELADVPQMEPVRRRLLSKARASYAKFLEQKGDDPVVNWGAGRAEGRLGNVMEMLGEYAEAERAYKRSLGLLGPLVGTEPSSATYRRDLAYARHGLGVLRKRSNRFKEAEADLTEAIRLRADLAGEVVGDLADRKALADSRYQLGATLANLKGRRRDQEQAYREALDAQAALVARDRQRPELRETLGRTLNNMGIMFSASNQLADAEKAFGDARDIEEALVKESPALPGPRWQLGRALNNLGAILLRDPDRRSEAEAPLHRARDLFATLAAEFPKVPQYRRDLASAHFNLAMGERLRGLRPEAEADLRRALDHWKRLIAEFPEMPVFPQKATETTIQLNVLTFDTHPEEAERLVREALAEQEKVVAAFPEVSEYAAALGRGYYEIGRLLVARGQVAEAGRDLDRAIALHRAALQADPENPTYRAQLGEDLVVRAVALIGRGDHARTAETAEELARTNPDDLARTNDAASFLVKCAEAAERDPAIPEAERPTLAASYESRAIQVLRQAVARRLIRAPEQLDHAEFQRLRKRPDFQKLRSDREPPRVG